MAGIAGVPGGHGSLRAPCLATPADAARPWGPYCAGNRSLQERFAYPLVSVAGLPSKRPPDVSSGALQQTCATYPASMMQSLIDVRNERKRSRTCSLLPPSDVPSAAAALRPGALLSCSILFTVHPLPPGFARREDTGKTNRKQPAVPAAVLPKIRANSVYLSANTEPHGFYIESNSLLFYAAQKISITLYVLRNFYQPVYTGSKNSFQTMHHSA